MPSAKALAASKKLLPKWQISKEIDPESDALPATADGDSPDPEVLQRKFFGKEKPYSGNAGKSSAYKAKEMQVVEAPNRGEDGASKQRKTVIYSEDDVIGAQG